jgi:phosphoheptose isomerase
MSQLGTSLSGWAEEFDLHTRSTSQVTLVGEAQDSEIYYLPNGKKCHICGQDGHLDQTWHRFANIMVGKLMLEKPTLAKQVVSANSTFITNAARKKSAHTSSNVRQVNTSFSPLYAHITSTGASMDASLISTIHHPNVAHETLVNKIPGGSSTGTLDHMVDHVQALIFYHFDLLIGTNYNHTLIEEINVNWNLGHLTPPAKVSTPVHVISSLCTTPTESGDVHFYDVLETEQVKHITTGW